jgi:hypothetical protein
MVSTPRSPNYGTMAQKPPSAWETEKASRDKPQPRTHSAAVVFTTLDNVFAAIVANKIGRENVRDCLAIVRTELDPAYRCELGDLNTLQRCRAAVDVWVAALASEGTGEVKPVAKQPVKTETAKTEVKVTAADILRAAAIAAGSVVELPTDPTARAIVAAGRKARNEKEDTL